MVKVFLVEDEVIIRHGIRDNIDWASHGFEFAGEAGDGEYAYPLILKAQPDILVTDIKMPFMDGLELSRLVKKALPRTRIIVLSGYNEFEYAKEAIDIEVEQYLLKPVNAEELDKVFSRIRETLDHERDEQRNIDKLNQYYMESLPLLQESFYTSLIEGRVQPNEMEKYLESYQIHLEAPFYVVTVLHISRSQLPEGMSPFLMAVSVKKLAEEQLRERYGSKILMYLEEIVVISQLSDST